MKRLLLTGVVVAVAALLAGSAHAKVSAVAAFRTPSGNIGCVYASGMGPRNLRCDIASRLKPRPAKPKRCVGLDWGDSYTMKVRGRVQITCHGDTAILLDSKVLRYGKTWSRGGFTCSSRASGLRCKNASGHGWFLSRRHSYRF